MDQYKIIKIIDENYSVIEFKDNKSNIIRVLKSKNSNQSATYTDERKFQLYDMYSILYDLSATFKKEVSNVLMLGGGGFSYPKYFISTYSDKKMDVVEIDKKIIEIANKYFFLDELYKTYDKNRERLKIYNIDAEKYLMKCSKKYDSILVDLYIDLLPINKIFTMKMLKKMSNILKNDGCFLINYIITDFNRNEFIDLHRNLSLIYSNVHIKTTKIAFNNNIGNVFVICSNIKPNFQNISDIYISISIEEIIKI